MPAARQKAERRGRGAEHLAALWLRLKGCRIVATRLKTPVGEIDLLVRDGETLVAVEVKRRDDPALAAAAIDRRQQGRIARALAWYVAHRPDLATASMRFDAFLVGRWRLQHLKDAWRPEP